MKKRRNARKRIIAVLLMLSLVLTSGTFAYWASYVEGTSETAVGTLTIGSAKGVETRFELGNTYNSGGLLVPKEQVINSLTGSVDKIDLTYNLQWLENSELSQLDGTTTTGKVSLSHQVIIKQDGEVLDFQTYYDTYQLINVEYYIDNPTHMTLNGSSQLFKFQVTMDEPKNQQEYNLISEAQISVVFNFIVLDNFIETIDNKTNEKIKVEQPSEEITHEAPFITLTGGNSITWELGTEWVDPGYKAYDKSGNIIDNVWASGEYNMWELGTYQLTYDCYSSTDNQSCESVTRTIEVIDTTAPVISMNNSVMSLSSRYASWAKIEWFEQYLTSGVWANDASNDLSEITYDGFESIDLSTPGTYYINFYVTDGSGNQAFAQREIIITE